MTKICRHTTNDTGAPDCDAVAVWEFDILGYPAYACKVHLPSWAMNPAAITSKHD